MAIFEEDSPPAQYRLSRTVCGGAIFSRLRYTAPQSLATGVPSNAVTAPPASCNMEQECSICFDRFQNRSCVALSTCHHVFHTDCIQRAFKFTPQCPVCRHPIGATQGKSPIGTMAVSIIPSRCSGFHCSSFCITYNIPAGYQRSYHDHPGRKHGGKFATAYLPHNEEGKDVLKRLQFAFKHGLSFTLGPSVSTGLVDQCIW
jgi:deltex-like protein